MIGARRRPLLWGTALFRTKLNAFELHPVSGTDRLQLESDFSLQCVQSSRIYNRGNERVFIALVPDLALAGS